MLTAKGWNSSGTLSPPPARLISFLCAWRKDKAPLRSMSEVDGLGLGLRHVSSMSTTLWFVEEGEGAGNWEGGARGCCSSSSTCSSMRVGGGGALFLVLLFKGGGGRG